jgi:hypothetical protein
VWPTAGWIGIDGLISGYRQNHVGSVHRRTHEKSVLSPVALSANGDGVGGEEMQGVTVKSHDDAPSAGPVERVKRRRSADIKTGQELRSVSFAPMVTPHVGPMNDDSAIPPTQESDSPLDVTSPQ